MDVYSSVDSLDNDWLQGIHISLLHVIISDMCFPCCGRYTTEDSEAPEILGYINNSRHLARKYARIFVRGHYLFREANSFPRAKLEENCELQGTDNVQGQISELIFRPKWRLLSLLSFKSFSQRAQF